MSADIEMYRGDTRTFEIVVTRDGRAVNLTGAQAVRAVFKTRSSLPDDEATIALTLSSGVNIVDPINGVIALAFPKTTTSPLEAPQTFVFDVEVTDSGGNVTTVYQGWMLLKRDVAAS